MNRLLFALLTGCVAAGLDSAPMIVQKLPRMSIVSACVQCVVVALVVFYAATPLPSPSPPSAYASDGFEACQPRYFTRLRRTAPGPATSSAK
jgi:hypothetical protein